MFDNKKMCLRDVFIISTCYVTFNKTSIEGHEDLKYDPDDAGQPHNESIVID